MPSSPAPLSPVRRRRRLTREQRERQRPLVAIYCDADRRLEQEGFGTAHPMRAATMLLARSAAAYEARESAIDVEVISTATLTLPGVAL